MTKPPPPRSPLRNTVFAALIPLAAIVIAGAGLELGMARAVHRDLVSLFGELREVALASSLVDELHGVEAWIQALPEATAETNALVIADVRQHYDEACITLARFSRSTSGKAAPHSDEVNRMIVRLDEQLDALGDGLATQVPIGQLAEQVSAALYAALSVSHSVRDESREIGAELDQRTDYMARVLLVLGLGSLVTVGVLGWVLLRRVLRPVSELRDCAVRFGLGEQDLQLPIRRNDELGELAIAFGNMAKQLRDSRLELEDRVEQRSREVLRTAKLAQLGTLAAGIAHEINNPLASIVACSDGLLRDLAAGTPDTENLTDYLAILRKEAMRARDITTKLLRFARDDQEKRELVWLKVQVHEVAALFNHQMHDAGVTLRFDWPAKDDADLVLFGDPAEWRQVIFNLLRNALDASPRGSCITVSGRINGDKVEMSVQDQGRGIASDLVEKVFEPFFTTKGPGQGTGLGLAIVHRIVIAHGGRIRIVNASPGACVIITMPAADAS